MSFIKVYCYMICILFATPLRAVDVRGTVVQEDGQPAKNVAVKVYFYAAGDSMQPTITTDEKGHFDIVVPVRGAGLIAASDPPSGHPDVGWAFYDSMKYKSAAEINVTGEDINGIELRLSKADPVLHLTIRSVQGKVIPNARVLVKSKARSDVIGDFSPNDSGEFFFVLPNDGVTVKVVADGFKEWSFQGCPEERVKRDGGEIKEYSCAVKMIPSS